MRKKWERYGLLLEVTGLIVLLAATYWEAEYTSWWDKSSLELQYFIQEKANLAMLGSISDLAKTAYVEDLDTRTKLALHASQEAREATFEIIKMRDERLELLKGQPELFASIRFYLLAGGAALILLGKLVFLRSLREQEEKPVHETSCEITGP